MKKWNYSKPVKIFTLTIIVYFKCCAAFSQQKISGYVRDMDDKLPLSSASIIIEGTNTGTSTDNNGFFRLIAKKGSTLVFSYLGYTPQEVTIGNDTVLNIPLSKIISGLDEVVVTGYTSQKIKEITGAVSVVSTADLTSVPDGEIEKILQGKVAGLTVIASGEPGVPPNIRINGIGNFGDVTPLYIIDGVQGDINQLNPNDIESIQVLKDAGSYSIYGVRGANGVLVITTKKGKSGKATMNFDNYTGVQEPLSHGLDLLNPQGQADLIWLALKNSGQVDPITGNPSSALYGNGPVPVLPDYVVNGNGYPSGAPQVEPSAYNIAPGMPINQIIKFNKQGTDWFHELFKPASIQNYVFSASGGSDKNHYLFSVGYLDQEGTFLETYLKKFTARINTDFNINNAIRFGENLQLTQSQLGSGSNTSAVLFTDPWLPVYDIKGNYSSENDADAGPADNPVAAQKLSKDNKNTNWQVFGNAFAEVDIFKGLALRSSFGGTFNFYNFYNYAYGPYDPAVGLDSFTENTGYSSSWTWTNTLNYSKVFAKKHSLKILAGTENVSNYMRGQGGTSKGYFSDDPNLRFLGNGDGVPSDQTVFSAATVSFLSSFISRAEYGYDDKYFFTATLRNDGSSVFGPENRFGWFPALSAAWRITQENFLKNSSWLTDLKLRGSWGESGYNGNTNPLNQFTVYGGSNGQSFYDIFGTGTSVVQGYNRVQYGNAKTGWQKDIMTDAGFESLLWNGKLSITADWYDKKSSGLLFPVALPALLGYGTPPNVNVGEVENKGVNVTIGSKGKFSKDLKWDLNMAITAYKSKVVKLNGMTDFYDAGTASISAGPIVDNAIGYPLGSFYGYKIIGIFQNQTEVNNSPAQEDKGVGRFRYLDANGDGVITDADRVHFGDPNPKFTAGINIGLTYKDFDFSTFNYWVCGNDVMDMLGESADIFPGLVFQPKSKAALYDSWTPQNPNAKIPIVEYDQNFSNNAVINSYPLEKGSYFRNKTMILGYTLPASFLQKFKINKFRVYAEVTNLFTITKYKGLDPELSGTSAAYGIDFGNYPNNQKQYLIGINLNF